MRTALRRASGWLIAWCVAVPACAQLGPHAVSPLSDAEARADAALSPDDIGEFDGVLASDAFEGREAGTQGEHRASDYIVSVLKACPALQPDGPDGDWLQPFPLSLHKQQATAHNVLARLPGSDSVLNKEFIVLGAHYDHVGFGDSGNALDPGVHAVHNGADDNGSGSSVLLDLATTLANSGWHPRRTILFQWYSGEELGLLGSKYWVAHPTHPVADVAAMINMDMVGRMVGRTLVVGGTGTSPDFSALARAACDELKLTMIDDPPGSAPSDNSSFYDAKVPSLFLFTGLHEDYHRATDDTEKLDLDGARDAGRLALRLLAAVDAADARPAFRASPGMAYEFTPHLYIGVAFEAVENAEAAVRAAVVIPGAPAAQAGLRNGDLVASVDGKKLESVTAMDRVLKGRTLAPLTLSVIRPPSPDDPRPAQTLQLVVQPVIR